MTWSVFTWLSRYQRPAANGLAGSVASRHSEPGFAQVSKSWSGNTIAEHATIPFFGFERPKNQPQKNSSHFQCAIPLRDSYQHLASSAMQRIAVEQLELVMIDRHRKTQAGTVPVQHLRDGQGVVATGGKSGERR